MIELVDAASPCAPAMIEWARQAISESAYSGPDRPIRVSAAGALPRR